MLYQKIPSGRFWIMPNDFFEKYKLNSRDFMVYCFLVSKKDKKGKNQNVIGTGTMQKKKKGGEKMKHISYRAEMKKE